MKEDIKKELEDLGVNLNDLPNRERPDLPDDYFAKMQETVISRLQPKVEAVPAQPNFWSQLLGRLNGRFAPRPALAFAGLAAALIAGFIFLQQPETETLPLADLNENTLAVYLENNIDDFDEGLIFELFAEADELSLSADEDPEELFIDEALDDLDIDQIDELL